MILMALFRQHIYRKTRCTHGAHIWHLVCKTEWWHCWRTAVRWRVMLWRKKSVFCCRVSARTYFYDNFFFQNILEGFCSASLTFPDSMRSQNTSHPRIPTHCHRLQRTQRTHTSTQPADASHPCRHVTSFHTTHRIIKISFSALLFRSKMAKAGKKTTSLFVCFHWRVKL